MNKSDELVLVIPTPTFHAAGLFQGLCRDVEHYLPLLDPRHFSFLPRGQAEDDPAFKQLIPYVVLKYRDRSSITRAARARARSDCGRCAILGIGGHVNPIDDAAGEHPYRQGMLRKIAEEVELTSPYRETCLGFINDDSLRWARCIWASSTSSSWNRASVERREADLTDAGFAAIDELSAGKDTFGDIGRNSCSNPLSRRDRRRTRRERWPDHFSASSFFSSA